MLGILLIINSSAHAYYETHPPYQFKQGPFHHAPDKQLSDKEIPLFIKESNPPNYLSPQVYQIDVDGNGTQDFISFVGLFQNVMKR